MTARSKGRIRSAAQAEALAEHLQQGAAIKVAETEHECSLLCGFPLQGWYDCNRFVTILQMQCLAGVQIPAERRSHSEMSGVPIPT